MPFLGNLLEELPMKNKATELAQALDELIALMELDGDDSHWYRWMVEAKCQVDARPSAAASHLLNAFGGMGSFNDYSPTSEEVDKLKTKVYLLAQEVIVAVRREEA
jgi:hypothetical protein